MMHAFITTTTALSLSTSSRTYRHRHDVHPNLQRRTNRMRHENNLSTRCSLGHPQSQSQSQSSETTARPPSPSSVPIRLDNDDNNNKNNNNIDLPAVIFVLGGPGSGKGTQCNILTRDFGDTRMVQLCVGDLLRREALTDSTMGRMISEIIQRGDIVPGDITMSLLQKELTSLSHSCDAVLIDGFPRAMDQAIQFERDVTYARFVLFFECDPSVMLTRLRARATSSNRTDDREHVFSSRLHTFQSKTMPVVNHYKERGMLRIVKADDGDVHDVYANTKPIFEDLFQQLEMEKRQRQT